MLDGKSDFDRALGERIREARERVGIKQDQLGRAVGLSRTSITNIERGRQGVQAHLLVRLAEVLGRLPAELLPRPTAEPSIPEKMRELEPSKREWAERVMRSAKTDNDHAS